jgi:catechol 2,3-dioxygenase-like lactoylglutathione lyase family enzyme
MKLGLAMIFAQDMARMTAFYRDALELAFLAGESTEGWAVFDAGGARLALHAIPAAVAQDILVTDPPQRRADGAIKLIFHAADPAAARVRLIAHGAVMFDPQPWGGCDGLDPEGNVFQLQRG